MLSLCGCRNYIDDSFRVYTGALVGNDEEEESSEEEEENQDSDMELEEEMGASIGSLRTKSRHKSDDSLIQQFMYGTSPGFKVWAEDYLIVLITYQCFPG